jgi:hypothetical protein
MAPKGEDNTGPATGAATMPLPATRRAEAPLLVSVYPISRPVASSETSTSPGKTATVRGASTRLSSREAAWPLKGSMHGRPCRSSSSQLGGTSTGMSTGTSWSASRPASTPTSAPPSGASWPASRGASGRAEVDHISRVGGLVAGHVGRGVDAEVGARVAGRRVGGGIAKEQRLVVDTAAREHREDDQGTTEQESHAPKMPDEAGRCHRRSAGTRSRR